MRKKKLNDHCKSFMLIGPSDGSEVADRTCILLEAVRPAHPFLYNKEIRSIGGNSDRAGW
jgi:hypothetical protein